MGKELLTEIVMDNDSGESSQTLSNLYSDRVTLKEIVGRTVAIIGGIVTIAGAVEIVRYYHLADYIRQYVR